MYTDILILVVGYVTLGMHLCSVGLCNRRTTNTLEEDEDKDWTVL